MEREGIRRLRIGRLHLCVWWKSDNRRPKPYTGVVCDICGCRCGPNKGAHIIAAHPNYRISRAVDRDYVAYKCGFCGCVSSSPAWMVQHVAENHDITRKADSATQRSDW